MLRLKSDGGAQRGLGLLETTGSGVGGAQVVLRHGVVGIGLGDTPEGGQRRLGIALELLDETQVVLRVKPSGIEITGPSEGIASRREVTLVEPRNSEIHVGGCRLRSKLHHPLELGGRIREPKLLE